MSLLIAKVVITERMSFTHAMQQIEANGLSYNWRGAYIAKIIS